MVDRYAATVTHEISLYHALYSDCDLTSSLKFWNLETRRTPDARAWRLGGESVSESALDITHFTAVRTPVETRESVTPRSGVRHGLPEETAPGSAESGERGRTTDLPKT